MVLFNRAHDAGRGLLRLDHVSWQLRRVLPKGATVSIEFADGLSLQGAAGLVMLCCSVIAAEQARVFGSADVLLIPHGAAAMNLHFLPMVAAVVDVNTWHGYGKHQASILTHMPPPYRVQLFTMNKFNWSAWEPKVCLWRCGANHHPLTSV